MGKIFHKSLSKEIYLNYSRQLIENSFNTDGLIFNLITFYGLLFILMLNIFTHLKFANQIVNMDLEIKVLRN